MGLILDGCVVAVLVFLAVRGGKNGLIKTVIGFFAWALGLLLAWQLHPWVGQALEAVGLREMLQSAIAGRIEVPIEAGVAQGIEAIEALGLPRVLTDLLIQNNNNEVYAQLGAADFGEYVSYFLANLSVNIIALILTFVVSVVLIKLITKATGLVNKIPIIGRFNQLLGAAAGLGTGVLLVWTAFLVITLLGVATPMAPVLEAIADSGLTSFLYNNNWLMDVLAEIL